MIVLILILILVIGFIFYQPSKSIDLSSSASQMSPEKMVHFDNLARRYQLDNRERSYLYDIMIQYNTSDLDTLRLLKACPLSARAFYLVRKTLIENTNSYTERKNLVQELMRCGVPDIEATGREYARIFFPPKPAPVVPLPPRVPPPPPPTPTHSHYVEQRYVNPFEAEIDEIYAILGISQREIQNQQQLYTQLYNDHVKKQKIPRTIYEDKENVHNSDVNDALIQAGAKLIKKYGSTIPSRFTKEDFCARNPQVQRAVDRIEKDKSIFKKNGTSFTLKEVFGAVLTFIYTRSEEEQDTLLRILAESLAHKSYKCGTGHLEAVVMSVQVFEQDCVVNIGPKHEIYSKVVAYFKQILAAAPENVIDNLTENDKTIVVNYINQYKQDFLLELKREYENILDAHQVAVYTADALNKYFQVDQFKA